MIPEDLKIQIKHHVISTGIRSKTMCGYDVDRGFAWVVDIDGTGKLSREMVTYMSVEQYEKKRGQLRDMAKGQEAGALETHELTDILH